MDVLRVICTFLMFGVLLLAIFKKLNTGVTLLIIGLVTIAIMSVVTKVPILGAKTTGSLFIDLFEFMKDRFISQMGGTVLVIMCVIGYVTYMDQLKATKMFAALVSRPLKKIKSPYLVLAASLLVMALIDPFIGSATGRVALYLPTILPLMLAAGVSKPAAATAILFGADFCNVGPTSNLNLAMLSLGDAGVSPTQYFLTKEMIVAGPILLLAIVIFCLVQKIYDKKDKDKLDVPCLLSRAFSEIHKFSLNEFALACLYLHHRRSPLILKNRLTSLQTMV